MQGISLLLASIGLTLSTMTFFNGAQLGKGVRIKKEHLPALAKMHRATGFITLFIFIFLFGLSFSQAENGISSTIANTTTDCAYYSAWSAWIGGLIFYPLKIWVVRIKQGYKYGSRFGLFLMIIWLLITYTHIINNRFII